MPTHQLGSERHRRLGEDLQRARKGQAADILEQLGHAGRQAPEEVRGPLQREQGHDREHIEKIVHIGRLKSALELAAAESVVK